MLQKDRGLHRWRFGNRFQEEFDAADAVVRNIEIIGEAAKGLSEKVRDQNPQIAWREIVRMRDKVVHPYFRIDLEIVWNTATGDIPQLRDDVQEIYDKLNAGE